MKGRSRVKTFNCFRVFDAVVTTILSLLKEEVCDKKETKPNKGKIKCELAPAANQKKKKQGKQRW